MVLTWFIVFLMFFVMELITMGLTTVWFAIGALVGFIFALIGLPVWSQCVVFVVVSTVILIFMRPFALKFINNKSIKTNVDTMKGKTGKVVKEINNVEGKGEILVEGLEWTARTENGEVLEKGTMVTIVRIEGVKAIVKKQ